MTSSAGRPKTGRHMSRAIGPILLARLLLTPALAQAAEEPSVGVAVMPPSLPRQLESVRANIEREVAAGIAGLGARTLAPAEVRAAAGGGDRAPSSCTSGPCLSTVGERLGVELLVFTAVESARRTFSVSVRVARAATSSDIAEEMTRCDSTAPCSPVPETAQEVAREAVRKALVQLTREREAERPLVAQTKPAESPPPPSQAPPMPLPASPARADSAASYAWMPWTALLGGAAVAGVGAYVLTEVDGRSIDCMTNSAGRTCYGVRDAAIEGWTLVGVGAVAAITGGVLFFSGSKEGSTSVALGPSALFVRGSF